MIPANDNPYKTKYPTCADCGLMFTAASIEDGFCPSCREFTRVNITSLVFWIGLFAMLIIALACAPRAEEPTKPLSWLRCYDHGDWKETPYCTAVAKGMEG